MRKQLCVLLLVLALWSSQRAGQKEELKTYSVTESLYVISGAGCNVIVAVTEEGILVVDSGEKPNISEKLLTKIRDISGQPIRYLVYTHYHHIVGAEGFPPSAMVISHPNTRDSIPLYRKILSGLFKKNIEELKQKAAQLEKGNSPELEKVRMELELRMKQWESIRRQREVLPQMTFEAKTTIYLGGKTVELLSFGPGHTNGDILVYFPGEKVIAVGDLIYTNGWVPRLDGDAGASIDNWFKIFRCVAAMDVDKIIPGHGEVADKEGYLKISQVFSEYLRDLKAEVKRYVEQGASLEKIKAELKLPKYQHMGMAEILLPWNIEVAFREIMASKATK